MCTYNRERFLQRAIDSVLNQTYKDIEFIIIDDGSTDNTEQIVNSYKDNRIRYKRLEQNSFYCYAANYGLKYCKGEYVAFMNSDDVWLPDKLEKQINFVENNKSYGACFTGVTLIDSEGNELSHEEDDLNEVFQRNFSSQKECMQILMKQGNFLCHPSALVRTEVLNQVGGFNLMYCQLADYDLWIRIVTEYPIYVIEEPLIKFRWDMKSKDQISGVEREKSIRVFNELVFIRKQLIERLTDEKFQEYFQEWFRNKDSTTPLELAFERAFILAECMGDAPNLKVLGLEKLEQVMLAPGAMEVLRNHFGMDIFELYQWNKMQTYWTPRLEDELNQQKMMISNQQEMITKQQNLLLEKDQHIENLKQHTLELEKLVETYANSTSWKMTEPFRKFTRMLKK